MRRQSARARAEQGFLEEKMIKIESRLGWLAALMLSVSPVAANNLVVNGDFETGNLSSWATGGNWTGFDYVAGSASNINPALSGGSYLLTLSNYSNQGPAQVSQTLSTVAGQLYDLSAIWANGSSNNLGNQYLNLIWNGQTVLSESATIPTGWTSFNTQVVGTGSDTLVIQGLSQSGYNAIDNVALVTAVPGPLAGAGLPALLGVLGFAGWRRRQKAAQDLEKLLPRAPATTPT